MNLHIVKDTGSSSRTIPDLIDYIAREFAPTITEIWQESGFDEYLMATSTQRHVWHAALAAPKNAWPPPTELRQWLTSSKRKEILKTAFGNCAPGMVRLLSKLGHRAESAEFYRAAHSALNRGDALTRILHHERTIDPRLVIEIAGLPKDNITVHIASHSLRHEGLPCNIEELLWLGRRLAVFEQSGDILDTVAGSSNPVTALRKAITGLPFPSAPWKVQELVLIDSAEELSRIARQLDNCLADRDLFYAACLDVQAGIGLYFRTQGDEFLLLKFSKFGGLGWYLDECFGRRNRQPTRTELVHIVKAVSHVDSILCKQLSYQLR